MPLWPFKRKEPESLTPTDLRARLIEAAASGSPGKLRTLCEKHKATVAAHLDLMTNAPENIRSNPAAMQSYIQHLGAVAPCLANECGAPQLWNKLRGTPDSNPLLRWQRWFGELPQRVERLEHATLIEEARRFVQEAQRLEGNGARQGEAVLRGRLGELLFHSGRVAEATDPFRTALKLCRELHDVEGQRVYLNNLLEAHRYLGEIAEAVRVGKEIVGLLHEHGVACDDLKKQLERIAAGEPLCRNVCCRDGKEMELNEVSQVSEGRYEFQFRRNRLSLPMTGLLVRHGNELASSGKLADALEKYQAATDVDPYDPDPVYQSGMCLLELGAYGKAREAFEEVERLAPGWFRCRSDRWLAECLEAGTVSDEEFRLLRALDDGGLSSEKAIPLAEKQRQRTQASLPFNSFSATSIEIKQRRIERWPTTEKDWRSLPNPTWKADFSVPLPGCSPRDRRNG